MTKKLRSLLAAVAIAACGPAQPEGDLSVVLDLVAELPAADVLAENVGTDLAASARPADGWAPPENDGRRDFRWSLGPNSAVDVTVLEARDLVLEIEARPFAASAEDDTSQVVTVMLGDRALGALTFERGVTTQRLTVPGTSWEVPGTRRLTFRYANVRRPADAVPGSNDQRRLALAFYGVRLLDGSSTSTGPTSQEERRPQVDADGQRLVLPAGVRLDVHLAAGRDAILDFADVRRRGGTLAVAWTEEDGTEERFEVDADGPARLALPSAAAHDDNKGERLVRLRLRATGGDVVLTSPRLLTSELPTAPAPAPAVRTASDERPANVLVYMIDTLRADHLGCYGSPIEGLTPRIDEFAAGAVLFENAVAQSSWTKSSVASVLTGLWPPEHGALKRTHRLGEEQTTLAEILSAAGYQAAGFVTNPNVTAAFGFDQGYEEYTDLGITTRSDEVTRAAVEWLGRRDAERPFFLYLHTLDPHDPYAPAASFRQRFAPSVRRNDVEMQRALNDFQAGRREVDAATLDGLRALYAAEVAFNDRSFGELLAFLGEQDLADDTWIVLLSDHGEEFYEHGHFRHGKALFKESIRVPLIVKPAFWNGNDGVRVPTPVQHIDVLPTLLNGLGVEDPPGLRGRDLLAALEPSPVFTYLHLDGPPRLAVLDGGWKLIQQTTVHRSTEGFSHARLFHLPSDPGESVNLAEASEVRRGYLASLLRRRLLGGRSVDAEEVVLDDELRRQLKALGYLQ